MNHIPVLLSEVLTYLDVKKNKNYIDATFGAGGHTQAILDKNGPKGKVLVLDQDPSISAEEIQQRYQDRLIFSRTNFRFLSEVVDTIRFTCDGGILFDLGVSSMQLQDEERRGFSFQHESFLDMRMGRKEEVEKISSREKGAWDTLSDLRDEFGAQLTAYHILYCLTEEALKKLFWQLGEEERAGSIARAIGKAREYQSLETTTELVEIITTVKKRKEKIHPATKVFQALRIAVNDELGALQEGLEAAMNTVEKAGRIAVISFHSLEDRIVKHYFHQEALGCICANKRLPCQCDHKARVRLITKKPVRPAQDEQQRNPRSRSAKLRVVEIL